MSKSTLFLLLGPATIVFSILYLALFVNIPYQDAPIELMEKQAFHNTVGTWLFLIGVIISFLAILQKSISFIKSR